jgi:hypothetical protein
MKKQGMNEKDHKHLDRKVDAELRHEIADIQLVFDNHTLINLLKNRGACIASGKHKKIKEHDTKIDKFLNELKGKEEVQKILGAFITFKTEDGYNEALRYIENPDFLKSEQ